MRILKILIPAILIIGGCVGLAFALPKMWIPIILGLFIYPYDER